MITIFTIILLSRRITTPYQHFPDSHNQFVVNHRNVSLFELSWLVETLRFNSGDLV